MSIEHLGKAAGMFNGGVEVAVRRLREAAEDEDWHLVLKVAFYLDELLHRTHEVIEGREAAKPRYALLRGEK